MVWGRDRAVDNAAKHQYARKVNKGGGRVSGRKEGAAPHPCGQACGPYDKATRTRSACTSTVRGGVCPCAHC